MQIFSDCERTLKAEQLSWKCAAYEGAKIYFKDFYPKRKIAHL